MPFRLKADFKPTGDQPQAIDKLVAGLKKGQPQQTLLGVTGSGKTFTIANVVAKTQAPTLVISHNKTLAAQLYQEFRDFFPDAAVSYFVSYYDYYQPEAYLPATDTYIEKETDINEEIDKLRLSATTNLLTRPDVIVVASVSAIYNLGSPVEYGRYTLELIQGQLVDRDTIIDRLTDLQYQRNDLAPSRGNFQVRGEQITIWPSYADYLVRLVMLDNQIETLARINPVTAAPLPRPNQGAPRDVIYPAKHYLTNPITQKAAIQLIKLDLKTRLEQFKVAGKIVEAYRLKQKVEHDLEMINEVGYVNGIENYSRYFDGRDPGQPPYTLIDYFHLNSQEFGRRFLTVIDESHMTIPQIRGMFRGDQARKKTLIDYGFRLPSALDNRPLRFPEFLNRVPQTIYTSATPSDWEISVSGETVEQLIRPTGLTDPIVTILPTAGQVKDLTQRVNQRKKLGQRVLVTTLTKKMAEALTEYLNEHSRSGVAPAAHSGSERLRVQYLHADVATLDRSDILDSLRSGEYDVVVGINLLREGLDLPEVSLVAILDADKEGFLRSKTSLIQTMGRAARHVAGEVVMYADAKTDSMRAALKEVGRRRKIQLDYNRRHRITPRSVTKPVRKKLIDRPQPLTITPTIIQIGSKEILNLKTLNPDSLTPEDKKRYLRGLTRQMNQAAAVLDFEQAAILRDAIKKLT